MRGRYHEGHRLGRCPDCAATERMISELPSSDLMRVIRRLDKDIRANPNSAPTLLARGMLHSKLGDDRRAIDDFTKAIALLADNVVALHKRAASRVGLGEYHLAKEDYDSIIRLRPQDVVARANRGMCLTNMGAIALDPGGAIHSCNRASGHAENGDLAAGGGGLDEAITLEPETASFHHNRGTIYKDLGEFESAIRASDSAIALEPLNHQSRQARGVARVMLWECASSVQDFDAILSLDPDNAGVLRDRGLALGTRADSTKPRGLRAIPEPGTRRPRHFGRPGVGLRREGEARPRNPGLH